MTKINFLSGVSIVMLAISTAGCDSNSARDWRRVTHNPEGWLYLISKKVEIRESTPDESIKDKALLLTDVKVSRYGELPSSPPGFVIALEEDSRSAHVVGAIRRAGLPDHQGKVLPVVVDRRLTFYFLTSTGGLWFSTNTIQTRVVLITNSSQN